MGFIISLLFGKLLQAIFFGRLRAIEVEVSLTANTFLYDNN